MGFGASGTLLCFTRRWLLPRAQDAIFALTLAAAVAVPVSLTISQLIPVESRFIPALLVEQILHWLLYWIVLAVPFILGASAVGLALMSAGRRLPTVYAVNLVGSGLGAILITLFMDLLHPSWLSAVTGAMVLMGAFPVSKRMRSARVSAWIIALIALATWQRMDPPQLRMDPFKYGAYVERLSREGRATLAADAVSPRSVVEIFEGDAFHELAFLSAGASPPPMHAILQDGNWSGSILKVSGRDEVAAVDQTLMAIPYDLVSHRPATLLLGETGGANVWLASLRRGSPIHVVQPDGKLVRLVRERPRGDTGDVLELPDVEVVVQEPRHYVDHSDHLYDIIHLSAMESWAVETGGVAGLHQNHLMTAEGMASCIRRLRPGGILSICRGIQLPPRDNLKILATLIGALWQLGSDDPGNHIIVLRDYLGVCTLAKRTPWQATEITQLRELIARRQLTPVYFPGIRVDELNQPDMLPGPTGESGDWLHFGATKLLSGDFGAFIKDWSFDIRPPTDDRPFFGNFSKLGTIPHLRRAFGELWLTRTELALFFVVVAMAMIVIIAALFTVAPLGFLKDLRHASGRTSTAIYFACIGLGYLILEMAFLSKLTHLIGDPVRAGSVTIASFLVFSGVGSLVAQTVKGRTNTLVVIIGSLVLVGLVEAWLVPALARGAGASTLGWRMILGALAILPLAFLMGFPMPMGLARLERGTPALIPWAWGINGFASVLAPPLATAIGMATGFLTAGALALGLYILSAMAIQKMPTR